FDKKNEFIEDLWIKSPNNNERSLKHLHPTVIDQEEIKILDALNTENSENLLESEGVTDSVEKNNYALFLEAVDLGTYAFTANFGDYFEMYIAKYRDKLVKLSSYFYFRDKQYEIESGDTYGFDY